MFINNLNTRTNKINIFDSFKLRQFIVFFISVIIFPPVYSQNLGKVTNKLNSFMIENYSVLENKKDIKEGPYELTIFGTLFQQGFYKNNLKNGIWSIYGSNNKLEFKYNYDTKELLFLSKDYLNQNDSTSRGPIFLGGFEYLLHFSGTLLHVPHEDLNPYVQSTYKAVIKIEVDENGIPFYSVQLSSGNITYDKEAYKCVKLASESNFTFLPAIKNGKPVSGSIYIPINLKLKN